MDNQLKNKLTRFEALPPESAWDKIVEALYREENFAERLYNYAETPSLTNWSRIEKNLTAAALPAKVISFATRFKKPIRYAAVASLIGVIAIATTLLMKRTEAGAIQAGSKTTVPTTTQTIISLPKQNIVAQKNPPTFFAPSVKEEAQQPPTLKRRLLNSIQPKKFLTSIAVAGKFIPKNINKQAMFNNAALNNYMVFTDGYGLAMRLPKKLFPLVHCNDGDASCLQRIKALQQKLSSSALATDFTAILEMLRQVQ